MLQSIRTNIRLPDYYIWQKLFTKVYLCNSMTSLLPPPSILFSIKVCDDLLLSFLAKHENDLHNQSKEANSGMELERKRKEALEVRVICQMWYLCEKFEIPLNAILFNCLQIVKKKQVKKYILVNTTLEYPMKIGKKLNNFNWDSLHTGQYNHYEAWSYEKKKQKKIKAYRRSV